MAGFNQTFRSLIPEAVAGVVPAEKMDTIGELAEQRFASQTYLALELEWLRSKTKLPLVLKGVRTAEDARVAVECGVNGILVSTHGGRQMDATLSAIESLPEVAEVCKGHAEVYLDSGVRRGSDVLKALALGARAVAVGRPLYCSNRPMWPRLAVRRT